MIRRYIIGQSFSGRNELIYKVSKRTEPAQNYLWRGFRIVRL